MKKCSCLYDTFKILVIFEISNSHFVKHNLLHILVEFESDRMSPRESAKNGRMGARGLNCKFFLILRANLKCLNTFEIFVI